MFSSDGLSLNYDPLKVGVQETQLFLNVDANSKRTGRSVPLEDVAIYATSKG